MTMTDEATADDQGVPSRRQERLALGMIAACCVGPMLLIAILTGVVGVSIGTAAAVAIGVTAGALCAGLMLLRHRRGGGTRHGPRRRRPDEGRLSR